MKMSDQIDQLATALSLAQSEMQGAKKDTKGHYGKYATLESVINASKEVLTKHGLSITQLSDDNKLVTILMHKSGQYVSGSMTLLIDKPDMQRLGSAYSYARRYGWMGIIGLPTEDDDGEAAKLSPGKGFAVVSTNEYIMTEGKNRGKKFSEINDEDLLLVLKECTSKNKWPNLAKKITEHLGLEG